MNYTLQPPPHVDDPVYNERRSWIRGLARDYHVNPTVAPLIEYTETENKIWRLLLKKLKPLHRKYASRMYLEGFAKLGFNGNAIPQLCEVSDKLESICGFRLIPIEGFVDSKSFLSCLRNHCMLCTQYVRHSSKPFFSDEPDVIHEMLGHTPLFTNRQMVSFYELIGRLAHNADPERLVKIERLAWFTMEAGLIEEDGKLKVYGTAILSSIRELQYCLSDEVEKRPFAIEEVVDTAFDVERMQPKLFFITSITALKNEIERYFN